MSSDESRDRFGFIFPMCAAIIAGGTLGGLGVQPFPALAEGARATMTFIAEKMQSRPEILWPITYPGKGVVTNRAGAVAPGDTLIQGIFPGGTQVRLYDAEGRELHRWKADFFKVWPDAEEHYLPTRIPQSQLHYFIQGMWPLHDGSIILNFGDLGAARLDACSRVMWRSDRPTHHSVTPTSDGHFLIPGHISVFKTPKSLLPRGMTAQQIQNLLGHDFKDYNNSILLVDANGKVRREISVLQAVYDAGLESAIYASLQEVVTDPTHLNDIEAVTPELAARMDNVNAGDLLISLREMHMLAVLDKESGHLKWHQQGPWVRQHDVDITADGRIEIFNNRAKAIGNFVDSSQILSFDPASGEIKVLFPVGKQDRFYAHIMGTHQALENGNRLIAETTAGRVFEVTPAGEVVWDFRMPYDEKAAALLTNAMRIPKGYFGKDALSCPSQG
jgi:hypothetical protein